MSGHSKWSSIKHKKAAVDARRGKLFTKLIKEITVATRTGGKDPNGNSRLRTAIAAAKAANMPMENVERAIKKGAGELPGVAYEEATYEGYGPMGVAVLIQAVTDNRNRTVADLRHVFSRHGGNMAEAGAVSWMFEKKGVLLVETDKAEEDVLLELALEAGAEDLKTEDRNFVITTSPENFESVRDKLAEREIPLASADLTMVPQSTIQLNVEKARQVLKLMDALEDHDDVQNVYANFDIPDSVMEEVGA
ncbi:MAG: YebC/PmpR family DNA-binding transcriptional regulator [Candidatus Tectomicrobia bacterium]|nr:YebC/PmpR family DNA-binding transcriptional regulator [Candidatus Tectomicrobia bacterium]